MGTCSSVTKKALQKKYHRTIEELSGYVGINLVHPEDIKKMIKKMEDSTIPEPEDPPEDCSMTKKEIWKKQISNYVKRVEMYNKNKNKLYSVIWGQCSDTMKKN